MKKLLGTLFLCGAAAVVALNTPSESLAQKGKTSASGSTIEIIESKDGKFRFSVRDADGKYVGGSAVGHASEKDAKEAAENLKKAIATATFTTKKAEAKKTDAKKDAKKDTKKDSKD